MYKYASGANLGIASIGQYYRATSVIIFIHIINCNPSFLFTSASALYSNNNGTNSQQFDKRQPSILTKKTTKIEIFRKINKTNLKYKIIRTSFSA